MSDKQKIKDIINALINIGKIKNESDFCLQMQFQPSSLSKIKTGDRTIPASMVIKLQEVYGINKKYLTNDNERMFLNTSMVSEDRVEYQTINSLPLISIHAFAGFAAGDFPTTLENSEKYIIPEFKNKADFLIRISGTSMSPKYNSGDIVACKLVPNDTFIQWGKVYVMDTEQGAICKRLFESKTQEFVTCHSDNTEKYPDFQMKWKQIRALAIVIGVVRLE